MTRKIAAANAANYPVRDIKVVYRSGDTAEIVATLVSQSIEPDELDAVVASLAAQPGVAMRPGKSGRSNELERAGQPH